MFTLSASSQGEKNKPASYMRALNSKEQATHMVRWKFYCFCNCKVIER